MQGAKCTLEITGTNQHGFKKKRSPTTAGLAIQSALARALDVGEYNQIKTFIHDKLTSKYQ